MSCSKAPAARVVPCFFPAFLHKQFNKHTRRVGGCGKARIANRWINHAERHCYLLFFPCVLGCVVTQRVCSHQCRCAFLFPAILIGSRGSLSVLSAYLISRNASASSQWRHITQRRARSLLYTTLCWRMRMPEFKSPGCNCDVRHQLSSYMKPVQVLVDPLDPDAPLV